MWRSLSTLSLFLYIFNALTLPSPLLPAPWDTESDTGTPLTIYNASLPPHTERISCKSSQPDWEIPPIRTLGDCNSAIHRVLMSEVFQHHDPMEFHLRDIPARSLDRAHQSVNPRKYTSGTCVVAVAMVDFYRASLLPDRGAGPFEENDVSIWRNMWFLMQDIVRECRGAGWGKVGTMRSIGVFVWARGSVMDKLTPNLATG